MYLLTHQTKRIVTQNRCPIQEANRFGPHLHLTPYATTFEHYGQYVKKKRVNRIFLHEVSASLSPTVLMHSEVPPFPFSSPPSHRSMSSRLRWKLHTIIAQGTFGDGMVFPRFACASNDRLTVRPLASWPSQ